MICTASTVLDSVSNLDTFVQENLAAGVDHVVMVLDEPDPKLRGRVTAHFSDHPNVTTFEADEGWWGAHRPQDLNRRQRRNANAVQWWLAGTGTVQWLVHIDADEVVDLDSEALARVPIDAVALHLTPLEAVNTFAGGREYRFKRLPTDAELDQLVSAGVISSAQVTRYFRGHTQGKAAVRPGQGASLAVHVARGVDNGEVSAHADPLLRVLHHHNTSGPDLLAKVDRMARAGSFKYNRQQQKVQRAFEEVLALPETDREPLLRALYEEHVADPVALLDELGLLQIVHPGDRDHLPMAFTAAQRHVLNRRSAVLRRADKRIFRFCPTDIEVLGTLPLIQRLRVRPASLVTP